MKHDLSFRSPAETVRHLKEFVDRLSSNLPSASTLATRDLIHHGEEGLGLEFLLDALYDHEVTPSPEDKLRLIQLGHFFEIPKHRLLFRPDPPANRDDHGGNAEPPRLLGGELKPPTHTIGFL